MFEHLGWYLLGLFTPTLLVTVIVAGFCTVGYVIEVFRDLLSIIVGISKINPLLEHLKGIHPDWKSFKDLQVEMGIAGEPLEYALSILCVHDLLEIQPLREEELIRLGSVYRFGSPHELTYEYAPARYSLEHKEAQRRLDILKCEFRYKEKRGIRRRVPRARRRSPAFNPT